MKSVLWVARKNRKKNVFPMQVSLLCRKSYVVSHKKKCLGKTGIRFCSGEPWRSNRFLQKMLDLCGYVTKSSWVNLNLRHYTLHLQPRNWWSLMLRWNISFFMIWLMHFSIFDDIANSLFVGVRARAFYVWCALGSRNCYQIDPKNFHDLFACP